MEIAHVRTTIVSLPRVAALCMATGGRGTATTVLVELTTDDGITGIGQTVVDPPAEGAAGIRANIDAYLAPAIRGQSPHDLTRLCDRMRRILPDQPHARAAVELALWDLRGKAFGVPVYQLLGGKVRDGVPLMAMLHAADPAALARETAATLQTPYAMLKLKIGMGRETDLARYRAVRDVAGDRAAIQVDANAAYTLAEALPILTAMEQIGGLGMIEQPVAGLRDLRALAGRFAAPVMADESLGTPADMLSLAAQGAAHAGFVKAPKHGGLCDTLAIAQIAQTAGIALQLAVYYDVLAAVACHLSAALPAVRLPSFVARLEDSLLTSPLIPSDMMLRVSEGPGWGVSLDADKVRRYTVDR